MRIVAHFDDYALPIVTCRIKGGQSQGHRGRHTVKNELVQKYTQRDVVTHKKSISLPHSKGSFAGCRGLYTVKCIFLHHLKGLIHRGTEVCTP